MFSRLLTAPCKQMWWKHKQPVAIYPNKWKKRFLRAKNCIAFIWYWDQNFSIGIHERQTKIPDNMQKSSNSWIELLFTCITPSIHINIWQVFWFLQVSLASLPLPKFLVCSFSQYPRTCTHLFTQTVFILFFFKFFKKVQYWTD